MSFLWGKNTYPTKALRIALLLDNFHLCVDWYPLHFQSKPWTHTNSIWKTHQESWWEILRCQSQQWQTGQATEAGCRQGPWENWSGHAPWQTKALVPSVWPATSTDVAIDSCWHSSYRSWDDEESDQFLCGHDILYLPLSSLVEDFKCSKGRLELTLSESRDGTIWAVAPSLTAGSTWIPQEALYRAKSALQHAEIMGHVQQEEEDWVKGSTLTGNPIRKAKIGGPGSLVSRGGRKMCQGCLTSPTGEVVWMGKHWKWKIS